MHTITNLCWALPYFFTELEVLLVTNKNASREGGKQPVTMEAAISENSFRQDVSTTTLSISVAHGR